MRIESSRKAAAHRADGRLTCAEPGMTQAQLHPGTQLYPGKSDAAAQAAGNDSRKRRAAVQIAGETAEANLRRAGRADNEQSSASSD